VNRFLQSIFTGTKSRSYWLLNDGLAIVTILSIIALVLETVPSLSGYETVFFIIEWGAVVIFSFEYFGRLYISRPIHAYPTSFFGVIDLVSILPSFVGLGNFTFLKSARALRIVRLLRMMRLAKVAQSEAVLEENFGVSVLNILTYFVTLVVALLLTGTACI
jgi:voltage-gated potassium channel